MLTYSTDFVQNSIKITVIIEAKASFRVYKSDNQAGINITYN